MKIGIDISQIVYEGTGVSRFLNGFIDAIFDYDTKNSWIFFFSSSRRKIPEQLKARIEKSPHSVKQFRLSPTLLSFLWNRLHVGNIERFIGKVDWFVTSDWAEPPVKNTKKVTIVHDLVYKRYPETVDKKILNTQKMRLPRIIKESNIIIADSKSTKKDLIEYFRLPDRKIEVIYPGVNSLRIPLMHIQKTLAKYKLNHPFILTVGKIEPRKNLKRLIEAFESANPHNLELVIVGTSGWEKLNLKQNRNIRYLGYVEDEELFSLYNSCYFFIFPSLWEGFGYPVVEAMTQNAAVTTSNTSSMAEVGKEATLLFDPSSVESIQKAISEMISNDKLRHDLRVKGKETASQFTWKNYYEKFMKTLYDYRS